MTKVNEVIGDIINYLNAHKGFDSVKFIREFPYSSKPAPMNASIVSIGIKKSETRPCFIGDGNSEKVLLSLGICVHTPYKTGSSSCNDIFFNVITAIKENSDFNFKCAEHSQISANRNTNSLIVEGIVTFEFIIKREV